MNLMTEPYPVQAARWPTSGRHILAQFDDGSQVRLQWDPDHDPSGAPLERRAIQLGLRGEALPKYAKEWLLGVEDISEFVRQQCEQARSPFNRLITPREEVYPVNDQAVAAGLGVTTG